MAQLHCSVLIVKHSNTHFYRLPINVTVILQCLNCQTQPVSQVSNWRRNKVMSDENSWQVGRVKVQSLWNTVTTWYAWTVHFAFCRRHCSFVRYNSWVAKPVRCSCSQLCQTWSPCLLGQKVRNGGYIAKREKWFYNGKAGAFGDGWTAAWQTADTGHRGEGGGLVAWPWFFVPGIGWSWTTGHRLSTLNSRHWARKSPWWSAACPHQTFVLPANRLALRNMPKNITRHAAQKTMSSLSLIFNTFLIRNNISGVIGLFLFTAVPFTLSIPFKVEEMNQLSFNGLLKPASRCMTLAMFKYCRTDAGRTLLAK